jgi:hypothetical protein
MNRAATNATRSKHFLIFLCLIGNEKVSSTWSSPNKPAEHDTLSTRSICSSLAAVFTFLSVVRQTTLRQGSRRANAEC